MTDLISEEKSNKSRIRRNEEKQKAIEYASKVDLPDKNPCIDESKLVYKCLNDNDYDRMKCEKHFENYRNCKKFWGAVKRERWWHGIKPHLPPASEREQVKKEFSKRHGYGYH